jgi:FolB domain-containing protein
MHEAIQTGGEPSGPLMQSAYRQRHRLRLAGLHVAVRLGHDPAERERPQAVALSATIDFGAAPLGCSTDRLADTVCGAVLCEALRSVCQGGEFALVEHLAARLHAAARALVPEGARVAIELVKLAPPIAGLTGGMSFTITDAGEASDG